MSLDVSTSDDGNSLPESQSLIAATAFQPYVECHFQNTSIISANGSIDKKVPLISSLRDDKTLETFSITYKICKSGVEVTNKSSFGWYLKLIKENIELENNQFVISNTKIELVKKDGQWHLIWELIDGEKRHSKKIDRRKTYFIGRETQKTEEGEKSIIIKNDLSISRTHCKLYFEEGRWMIQDMNSRNGVYIKINTGDSKIVKWDQTLRIGKDTYMYFSK